MKKFLHLGAFIIVLFMMNSCATILNGKNQKINVNTNSSNSKVYLNDELAGTGSTVVVKMPRNRKVQQIRVENEGFKPVHKIHYQTSKSPLYIMSWIPFGILFYPPLMDFGEKAYDYKKNLDIPKSNLAIKKRTDVDKYVYLKKTSFDVKKEDIKIKTMKHKNFKKQKKVKDKNIRTFKEDVKFDNSIFSEAVEEILKSNNYTDTTKTIFKSKSNTLYISSKITKVDFQHIYNISAKSYMDFMVTKLEIEWEIFDLYDQSKFKKLFNVESGEFSMQQEDAVKLSVEDAISDSFYKFMDSKEIKAIIKKENTEKVKYDNLTLTKAKPITNLNEALNATVTIKTKDGHGSGCLVSKDGYIVTNFHVISNNDKITVVDKNGKEYPAKLIRKNENLDLALIKADQGEFEFSYHLPNEKNYMVGDDIFVIGTPTSIELGQTLTKGIISGSRKFDENEFIQTDASVNGGNSGGALTTKKGELIGIVNAKVSGFGVEGIGFSIPAEFIKNGLFIQN